MGWFKRSKPSTQVVAPLHAHEAERPRKLLVARHDEFGDVFLVSGVTHRQASLRAAGVGLHEFRLVCEPTNEHDPDAVKVMCGRWHIGYITAKTCARYGAVVQRAEAAGYKVFVNGQIKAERNGAMYAELDCCWPEDIAVPGS